MKMNLFAGLAAAALIASPAVAKDKKAKAPKNEKECTEHMGTWTPDAKKKGKGKCDMAAAHAAPAAGDAAAPAAAPAAGEAAPAAGEAK